MHVSEPFYLKWCFITSSMYFKLNSRKESTQPPKDPLELKEIKKLKIKNKVIDMNIKKYI